MNKLIVRGLVKNSLPITVKKAIKCLKILEFEYGHLQSVTNQSSVDANSSPIPWYTYPAIEYIKQLDLSNKVIFEYGAGNSTLFWGRKARQVLSVEENKLWYEKVSNEIRNNKNIELQLIEDELSYVQSISQTKEDFDVIVIDGCHNRYECAWRAVKKLKPGGMIILDNSDWSTQTCRLLRDSNLIQVDMSGFGPINDFIWTTSFFLEREFNFTTVSRNQPELAIGSLDLRDTFLKGDSPFNAGVHAPNNEA